MPAPYEFRPRLITTLAAVAGMALALAAANWQLNRAHEKEALAAKLESLARGPAIALSAAGARAEDLEWRRVTASGRFAPAYAVFIDNRIRRGVAGFHVVMPLEIGKTADGGSRYVLVNRGWVAGSSVRDRLPEVATPEGTVQVTGLAVVPGRRFLELSADVTEGRIWQNLTLERYRAAFPIAIQPVMIQQESLLEDGLVREWDPPDLGVNKHYGYAFQWLALAATVLVFYLVTHVRRRPR
ncbi:MAG TPA: SURF1 family protein [Burkholderiales bacterium]|nr:SURF1 family protein [Burkholderiales bacterium]